MVVAVVRSGDTIIVCRITVSHFSLSFSLVVAVGLGDHRHADRLSWFQSQSTGDPLAQIPSLPAIRAGQGGTWALTRREPHARAGQP